MVDQNGTSALIIPSCMLRAALSKMVNVKVSMVWPHMCDDKRSLTLNTAELLPNISDNHH
jgi:hypothetical protein